MPKSQERAKSSESVENFVKAVYKLQQESERVSTNALKDELSITAPSVTDMARRLVDEELVDYQKYRGVRLTQKGTIMALQILRRHRMIELYLVRELGYEIHEVHDEAEQLEHAVSDRFIAAIAEKLDHPIFDPHGDPIPSEEGLVHQRELLPLSEIPLATPARVARYIAADSNMLQYTLDRGLELNALVEIVQRDPFNGPITLRLHDAESIIGHQVAKHVLVELME